MKAAKASKTALVLIDVQNGFLHPTHWGSSRSTPDCEANISLLLAEARAHNDKLDGDDQKAILICHVHHHSIYPDSALHPKRLIEVDGELVSAILPQKFAAPRPGETVWVKDVNSAFIGTRLEDLLRTNGVRQLIICGLTTDHCVSTSTRMAKNLRVVDHVGENGRVVEEGDIVLVSDASATYAKGGFDAETVHRVNLVSLNGEFAQVEKTVDVIRMALES